MNRLVIFKFQLSIFRFQYITLICFIWLLTGCASYNVIHVTDSNKEKLFKKQGFYYNLPQTAIKVDITVKQNRKLKGQYADYAEKLLGLKNAIKENSVNYGIVNVSISNQAQRDPGHFYFLQTPHCVKKHKALLVNFTKDGLIESINYHDKTKHPFLNQGAHKVNLPNYYEDIQSVIEGNVSETIDTIVEKITSNDTIQIEKKTLKKTFVEKPSEQKAKESADYLMKIKSDKYNLLSGISEAVYSKETMEYMISQLAKQEQEYLALFKGDTASSFLHYSFTFIPVKNKFLKDSSVFVFSPKEGVLKNTNGNGEVVTITVEKSDETLLLNKFQSQIDNPARRKNGFYYRIPETAKISIHKGNALLAEANLPISQFGIVSHLPVNLKKAIFYHDTGTIKSLKE